VAAGNTVTLSPVKAASHHKDWKGVTDDGDLYIGHRRIEVKQISATFSSALDFPFRPDFIVCAVHSWERAHPKPHRYFIVSGDGKHMGVVRGIDQPHWTIKRRQDHRYQGVAQDCYLCPLDLVEFVPMRTAYEIVP
jgi:hypothetical protein